MRQAIIPGDLACSGAADDSVAQIRTAFWSVARSIGKARVHERLLREAGVRLDRAGAALLYILYAEGAPLRVPGLAEMLGVDAPTVTRKVQQLEREGLVTRQADEADRRATRIALTSAGRQVLESVLGARRAWFDRLLEGWDERDLAAFASMLDRFTLTLERDVEGSAGVGPS